MIHLTFTGRHAGTTFCGLSNMDRLDRPNDQFVHFTCAPASVLESVDLCPHCEAVLYETAEEAA